MKDRLEPEHAQAFHAYRTDPSPANAGAMLRSAAPIIAMGSNLYGGGGPLVHGHARRLALDAIESYDPRKSSLRTHIMGHLKGLQRYSMKLNEPVAVPEQLVFDRRHLHAAAQELRDRHDRDPSDEELADHTGLSRARIGHVRKYQPATTEGEMAAMFGNHDDEGSGPYEPTVAAPDRTRLYAEFLYPDSDPVDQLILEHTLGLNGAKRLSSGEIARRANLSPAAVSQRARRLQARIDELDDMRAL